MKFSFQLGKIRSETMCKCLPATQGTVNAISAPLPCGTVISSIDHSCQIEEFVPRKGFLAHASPTSYVRSTCVQDRTYEYIYKTL